MQQHVVTQNNTTYVLTEYYLTQIIEINAKLECDQYLNVN